MKMLRNRIMAALVVLFGDENEQAASERRRFVVLSVLSFLALC